MVSTPLKNISQNGNLPQIGVKIKNIWNHHLGLLYLLKPVARVFVAPKKTSSRSDMANFKAAISAARITRSLGVKMVREDHKESNHEVCGWGYLYINIIYIYINIIYIYIYASRTCVNYEYICIYIYINCILIHEIYGIDNKKRCMNYAAWCTLYLEGPKVVKELHAQ